MFYTIIRLLLGALFIFSGWVKAIDPAGLSYKIEEYSLSFEMPWLADFSMTLAVTLCAFELFIGLMMFFKLWQKVISTTTFIFISFFTIVTFITLIFPSVSINDCGCFGDVVILTNSQTFWKNVIFLLLAFLYVRHIFISSNKSNSKYYYDNHFMSGRKKRQLKCLRFFVYLYIFSFSLAIPIYSVIYLPPYTHLPYDIGESAFVTDQITTQESETKLVYENIATGEKQTFDIDDPTWQDDTKWKYVETQTTGDEIYLNKTDLVIFDNNKQEVTKELLDKPGYTFLVIAHNIKDLSYQELSSLESLLKLSKADKIELTVVTATPIETAEVVLNTHGWVSVDVYNCDLVQLKSLLRDKKGVVLFKDGIISGKWNFKGNILKNISYNDLQPLVDWERNVIIFFFVMVGLFMAIMLYLVIEYHRSRK